MSWDFNNQTPIYLQLIRQIKVSIVNGTFQSEDKLPAVRDLAKEAGVNPNTVQKAFVELERDGLVQSDRTNGRYVTKDKKLINKFKKELSDQYINDMFENLKQLGMSNSQIKKTVSKWEEE